MAEKVGEPTGQTTEAGKPVFKTPEGELVSEKSATIKMGNKFINVPSIHDGVRYSEDELIEMLKNNKIEATSVHDTVEEAVEAAKERSSKLLAKGGSMENQMEMFEDGGLKDEGGTVDPVSGNDVPSGSTQAEVRDDIPAQLSEGEFVFPADVVRYIGLENLMKLRQKAKQGLQKMEAMGQMGNSEEATMDDDGEYEGEISEMIESIPLASGGMVNNPFARGLKTIKAQAGTFVPQQGLAPIIPPVSAPPPQVPTNTITAPQLAQSQMRPKRPSVRYDYKQYQGPSGEMITVAFINGQPTQQIPPGYTEYDPTKPAKPEVVAPKVETPQGGDDQDRERDKARRDEYKDYLTELNVLSELSPTFKEYAEKNFPGQVKAAKEMVVDPKTGEISFPGMSFADQLKGALSPDKFKEISEGFKGLFGENAFEKAYDEIAKNLGVDLDFYKTEGLFGESRLDKNRALEDMKNFASKSDEEQQSLRETASRFETNPMSQQTEMLREEYEAFGADPFGRETGSTQKSFAADTETGMGKPVDETPMDFETPSDIDRDIGNEENENDGGAGIDSGTPFSTGGLGRKKGRKKK